MKNIKWLFLAISMTMLMGFDVLKPNREECDLVAIYKLVDLPSGTKGIDDWGNLVEVETLLVPTSDIEEGRYEVSLTRKDSNLYKVDGMDLYVATNYCYEYATYDDAILIIKKGYGRIYGTVIFI